MKTRIDHRPDVLPPLVERLDPAPDVEGALARLRHRPHCVLLDSARRTDKLGRYSFLAADPFTFFTRPADDRSALDELAAQLANFAAPRVDGLPPFQGGALGLFSYEFGQSFERLPPPRCDEFGVPGLAVGFYDVVLAWDHQQDQAWIVSHGFPAVAAVDRRRRAAQRLQEIKHLLAGDPEEPPSKTNVHSPRTVAGQDLAPQFAVPGHPGLTSNLDREAYLSIVRKAIDYIHAGDVFQVNLAQRLLFPAQTDSWELYLRLRNRNPAPFAAYFDLGEFQVLSASPERFVRVADGHVEARPIKGTRQRTAQPEADLFAGDELEQSEKDRAENVMIVDLLRNDLSRVCDADSVRVTQLCGLETFQYVQHLVSAVEGRLEAGRSAADLIRAAFPGGSITGAPKVRAMEIIAELEPTARGPYCGSLGYLGFDGALDMNILIRTITAGRGWWQFPVGGGIVAQSTPEREYEETWHKAAGMIRALQ